MVKYTPEEWSRWNADMSQATDDEWALFKIENADTLVPYNVERVARKATRTVEKTPSSPPQPPHTPKPVVPPPSEGWATPLADTFVMPIGKHKNKTLEDIKKRSPDYLVWLRSDAKVPQDIRGSRPQLAEALFSMTANTGEATPAQERGVSAARNALLRAKTAPITDVIHLINLALSSLEGK